MSVYRQLAEAMRPSRDMRTLQNARRAITDDGRARLDRATGILDRAAMTAVSSVSVQTEPNDVTTAENLEDQLSLMAATTEVYAPVGIDTASVDITVTPTASGSEIAANVLYSGTGAVATAARGDHNHDITYSPVAHTHTGVYAPPPMTATAALDFPSIAAQGCAVIFMTVTGAAVGNVVTLGPPSGIETGLMWGGYVLAADTVSVRLCNVTAAAIDPASATWRADVWS